MQLKKGLLFVVVLLFINCSLFAQLPSFTIIGKALSTNKKPIEFGNVIALTAKDSSLITGAPFENGQFKLMGLSSDSFLIKISSVGYREKMKMCFLSQNDSIIDVGEFILEEANSLSEITIAAKVPLFEMDGEKVKVNVEGTSLTTAGNALDVLRRSPGIQVSSTDNVSVFGKGTAIIYIDGMLLSSVDILKSLPSTDIKSVEIIRNPSARYDAGGRAVINITTIRSTLQGYNGNIVQNTMYIKSLFSYTGFRINYTKNKWSTFIGFGTNMGQQWTSDEYKRTYKTNDSTAMEMNNSIYDKQNFKNVYYYRAGLNYRPDSTSTFGVLYYGFYNGQNNTTDNNNVVLQNNQSQYQLHTFTNGLPVTTNNAVNANYIKRLDTLGTELFIAAQYGVFNIKNISTIHQETKYNGFILNEDKRNLNTNDINIITAQVDFTKVFNKQWKLESGIKESNISKTSDIKFENYKGASGWISDPSYLNGFSFSENIVAAYTELRYKKKKLNSRLGLRSEMTKSDGFSKVLNKKIIDRQYINLFPSAFLGYDFTPDLTTSLTLSSRINRPTFQDLDPFINYIDSVSSFRGNPYLLPEYTNSVEAALVYMKEANITFGYNNTKGSLNLVVDKLTDSTDAFTATTKNLNKSETYSAGITIPYELKWWTTANYFGYFITNFTYQQNGVTVKNNKPTFSIYLYDEFRFKKICSLEITYEYTSSAVDGIFVSKPFSMLTATLKKNFFKDKLTCRFMANDILRSYIMRGQSNIPLYNVNYKSYVSTHYYMISLNYKFGKLKNNNYKNRSVSDDEYNRVKTGK
jgi:outer membrane receptor protein involved in Fe transport